MSEGAPPETSGIKMGDLTKLIKDTVAEAITGMKPTDSKPDDKVVDEDSSVAAKVRAEIEKISANKKKEEKEATIDSELKDLREKTKEKAPVERTKLHKLMGWGENAD